MIYTSQLFALYFDIVKGFVLKKEACESFLKNGLANFHLSFVQIGVPYHYFQQGKIICLDLKDTPVKVGDVLYYYDDLHRFISLRIVELQQNKITVKEASNGKMSFNVEDCVPKNRTIYLRKKDLL